MNTGNKLDNLLQKTQTQILASVGRKEEDKHTVFPKGSLLTSEWRETSVHTIGLYVALTSYKSMNI